MKDNNIEVFHNQIEALNRIEDLKENGYKEEDMYIISGDEKNISMLRGSTDVIIKEEETSLFERFKSFLKGEDSITEAFTRMRLNDEDKKRYHDEVKNGKIILYIDKEYGSYYELHEEGLFRPVVSSDEFEDIPGNVRVENEEILKSDVDSVKDVSDNIRKDIGLDSNPDIIETKDKKLTNLIMEEDRKIIR